MKRSLFSVFSLSLLLLSGYVVCSPIPDIVLVSPAKTTDKPTLPISYYSEPCALPQYGGNITCGKEYCDIDSNYIFQFRPGNSPDSFVRDYNMATYIRLEIPPSDYCVDHDILATPNSGYFLQELEDINFAGILKIHEIVSNRIHFVPFKTRPLKAKCDKNRNKMTYDFTISSMWNLTPLRDTNYLYVANQWLTYRKSLNTILRHQFLRKKIRLPTSNLVLELTYSSDLNGKVYDARLTGKLGLPHNQEIDIRFASDAIRFAKPGYNNLGKWQTK